MIENKIAGGAKVYPRVGGGTWSSDAGGCHPCGLSPRGRGNRSSSTPASSSIGSIPAWAGEPRPA